MFPSDTTLRPYFYLALAVLGWALEPIVIKLLVEDLNVLQINFYLSMFSMLTIGFVAFKEGQFHHINSYSISDWTKIGFLAFLGMIAYNLLFVYGFNYMTAAETNSLNYLWPLFVTFFAMFILKERPSLKHVLSIALGFCGVLILFNSSLDLSLFLKTPLPAFVVILAAVCWALYNVLQKKYGFEIFSSLFAISFMAFSFFAVFTLVNGAFIVPDIFTLMGLLFLGAVPYGLSIAFYMKALRHGKTYAITFLSYATPFVSLALAKFMLFEPIYWRQIIALLLLVGGALVYIVPLDKNDKFNIK